MAVGAQWRPPRFVSHHSVRRSVVITGMAATASFVAVTPVAMQQSHAHPLTFAHARPSLLVLLAVIGACAIANAIGEELLWRGVLTDALDRNALGPQISPAAVVLVDATSFGLAHWHGLPGGPIGIGLSAAFGMVVGLLRRAVGLTYAITCHAVVDVVLFCIAVHDANFGPQYFRFE